MGQVADQQQGAAPGRRTNSDIEPGVCPGAGRATATAHPALGRILAAHRLTVGPVFAQLETVHAILCRAGFAPREAVRVFYSLFTYVFGFVMWELPRVHQHWAEAYVASWNNTTRTCMRCART
jgi:hypothetical protein